MQTNCPLFLRNKFEKVRELFRSVEENIVAVNKFAIYYFSKLETSSSISSPGEKFERIEIYK